MASGSKTYCHLMAYKESFYLSSTLYKSIRRILSKLVKLTIKQFWLAALNPSMIFTTRPTTPAQNWSFCHFWLFHQMSFSFFITHQASNHTFTIKENAPMNTQSPQPSFLRHERLQCISAFILFQFHWPAPTERGSLSSPRDSFMAFGYESFGGTWVVIKYWHLTLWWWLNMS